MTGSTLVSVETSKLFHFLFKAACILLVWCYKAKITMFTQKMKKIKNRLTNDSIASNRIFFKYTLFWKILHVYFLLQRNYLTFCIKQLIWKIMQLSQIMYPNPRPQESSIVIRKIFFKSHMVCFRSFS